MRTTVTTLLATAPLLGLVLAPGCASKPVDTGDPMPGVDPSGVPVQLLDVPLTRAPYEAVHITWKQRLDQAYVFVEHTGDYRQVGQAIKLLLGRADELSLVPTGPLFCLYYDDPGTVPVAQLRARACMPVGRPVAEAGGLRFDVLPSTTVAYAIVEGPTWDLPRTYPAIYGWLAARGWTDAGPVREVYLNLGGVEHRDELLTEVQVPWAAHG